jgi:hypothetical protein
MTVNNFQIPLQGIAQQFTIDLNGVTYTLTVKWNDSPDAGWAMDIADEQQNPLACYIPLVTGTDLLEGLEYLGIGGSLVVYTEGDATAVPTFENLGTGSNLYFQMVVS